MCSSDLILNEAEADAVALGDAGDGKVGRGAGQRAVAGIAERNGIRFGFIQYLAYGVPMTLVSIAICQVYVWLRYF